MLKLNYLNMISFHSSLVILMMELNTKAVKVNDNFYSYLSLNLVKNGIYIPMVMIILTFLTLSLSILTYTKENKDLNSRYIQITISIVLPFMSIYLGKYAEYTTILHTILFSTFCLVAFTVNFFSSAIIKNNLGHKR